VVLALTSYLRTPYLFIIVFLYSIYAFSRTTISAVDVTAIEVDKSSFGYSKIKALTQDITSALACGKPKNGLAAITFIIAVLALGRSIAGLIFDDTNTRSSSFWSEFTSDRIFFSQRTLPAVILEWSDSGMIKVLSKI